MELIILYTRKVFTTLGIVGSVLLQHINSPPMLSAYEINVIQEAMNLLQPFEMATRELSAQKYVTASVVIPISALIRQSLDKTQAELPENKQLLEQFIKKFDNIEKMCYLGISIMLDPRFKKLYFKNPVNIFNVISSIDNELKIVSRTNKFHPINISRK